MKPTLARRARLNGRRPATCALVLTLLLLACQAVFAEDLNWQAKWICMEGKTNLPDLRLDFQTSFTVEP